MKYELTKEEIYSYKASQFVGKNKWETYVRARNEVYQDILSEDNLELSLISEANWILRSSYFSGREIDIECSPGDIVYVDFGPNSYLNEMDYQHFAFVISLSKSKAFVVPMTSNRHRYEDAYDPKTNPLGKMNLMRFDRTEGLEKDCVLYLNDAKCINTARIIRIQGHIPVEGEQFKMIRRRLKSILF